MFLIENYAAYSLAFATHYGEAGFANGMIAEAPYPGYKITASSLSEIVLAVSSGM